MRNVAVNQDQIARRIASIVLVDTALQYSRQLAEGIGSSLRWFDLLYRTLTRKPKNNLKHFIMIPIHNNIRKTGSFRNRQLSGSGPLACSSP